MASSSISFALISPSAPTPTPAVAESFTAYLDMALELEQPLDGTHYLRAFESQLFQDETMDHLITLSEDQLRTEVFLNISDTDVEPSIRSLCYVSGQFIDQGPILRI